MQGTKKATLDFERLLRLSNVFHFCVVALTMRTTIENSWLRI